MGWSAGSELAQDVWDLVRPYIPEAKRKEIAKSICDRFGDHDCDTLEEAEILYNDAYKLEDDEIEKKIKNLILGGYHEEFELNQMLKWIKNKSGN